MYRRFAAYHEVAPLLLRLGVGLVFFMSGLSKITGAIIAPRRRHCCGTCKPDPGCARITLARA